MEKTLKELASYVGGDVIGDENIKIKGVMTIDEAREGYITFVSNEKYIKKLDQTRASAIIISQKVKTKDKNLLVAKNPYLAYAKIFDLMMNMLFTWNQMGSAFGRTHYEVGREILKEISPKMASATEWRMT